MKLFLVHLASLAVMLHMAFGCHWHHGLGAAGACAHQSRPSACCLVQETEHDSECDEDHADQDHEHHHGDHEDVDAPLTLAFDSDGAGHGHHHSCCQDDGCNLIKVVQYEFTSLDFVARYLGGAEDSSILGADAARSLCDPFPDCRCFAPNVRAHLLLGVQLI